jgi:dTDP-4-amino-4,6-dideoxygalactose transaminase
VRIGINGRLDTVQAAILLAKFEIFEEEIGLRQKVATSYSKALGDNYTIPYNHPDNMSVWAQYSILHQERDKIIYRLKENGIPTAIYYPKPLHLQKAFESLIYKKGDFPVAEQISNQIFSLPMHPYLAFESQDTIIKNLIM